MAEITDVLDLWFGEPGSDGFGKFRGAWFGKDSAFDAEVRSRFGKLVARASVGSFDTWQETPEGALALTIALDQFPRNIFRGLPKAFAADAKARSIALRAIDRGFDRGLLTMQRLFLYLLFQHSGNLADQRQGPPNMVDILEGFEGALYDRFEFAIHRHCEIIERFGRFPHRNQTLVRLTSAIEAAFLKEPRSSFG
ncbi:MAG: hypothetical protein CL569_15165 [Alphaproteobacteria bacterium]|nr:hypothetical protein [Alphaproteobacteria bacterium]